MALKDAPHFLFNNPIALQKKYLKLKNDPNMKIESNNFRIAVRTGEENALETLSDLLDWLDGLEPQPTMGIVPPCGMCRKDKAVTAGNCAPMGKTAANGAKRSVVRCLTYLHLVWASNLIIIGNRLRSKGARPATLIGTRSWERCEGAWSRFWAC